MTSSMPTKRRKLDEFQADDGGTTASADGAARAASGSSPRASDEPERKIAKVSAIPEDHDDNAPPPSEETEEPATYEAAMEALNKAFAAFVAEQLVLEPQGDLTQAAQEYIAYAQALRVQFGIAPAPSAVDSAPTTSPLFDASAASSGPGALAFASSAAPAHPPRMTSFGSSWERAWGSSSSSTGAFGGLTFRAGAQSAVSTPAGFSFGTSSGFGFAASTSGTDSSTAPASSSFGFSASTATTGFGAASASSGFSFGLPASASTQVTQAIKDAFGFDFSDGAYADIAASNVPDTEPSGFSGFLAAANTYGSPSIWNDPELLQLKADATAVERQQVVYSSPQSEVACGVWKGTTTVALKRLAVDRQSVDNAFVFATNAKAIAALTHPRLVALVGVEWTKAAELQVASEFMPRGDLRSLHASEVSSALTWANFKCQVAIDIVDALAFLHSQPRRLSLMSLPSSRKVLLTEDARAKLSLVSSADFAQQRQSHAVRYMAPELIVGGPVSDAADMYSLGVLLCELDTTSPPYDDAVSPDGAKMEDELVAQQVAKGLLIPTPSPQCPESIVQVIRECTTQDPALRPTAVSVAYTLREILKSEL